MIACRGVLHDAHLRAAIRVALRAHGFAMSDADYRAAARAEWQVGCWLRDRALPECLADSVTIADYQRIASVDPRLWHQLPLMAALGYRETRLLLGLVPCSLNLASTAGLMGSVFNAGIALFDYLVDESPTGMDLFDLLNGSVVRELFDPMADVGAELARAGKTVADPRVRLLLGIVTAFAKLGRQLHRDSGNDTAWNELRRLVLALFEAEHAASVSRCAPARARELLPALETKSAGPSLTLLQIACLAAPRSTPPPQEAYRVAAALGRLFWRLDDLVDLLADCRRAAPSALLLQVSDRLAARGTASASDADFYDVVDSTAKELVDTIEQIGSFPDDSHAEPSIPVEGARRFARESVAGWTRWHEDCSATFPVPSEAGFQQHPSAGAAVDMLLAQRRVGLREATHRLCFPQRRATGLAHEAHSALLFQRAVVLDSLIDAHVAGLRVPRPVIDAEAMALLRLKHRQVRGGWSYLPDVPEIPPDADDLGQVLQALARLGGPVLAFTCEEPIRLALDGAGSRGGFRTWIFEPGRRSRGERLARANLNVIGGAGVHPEVVANLLVGLLRYDPVRFRETVLAAVPYLESMQDDRGAWESHWYAGPYYGTYRVGAVLAAVTPGSAAVARAKAFLEASQRADGGWGVPHAEPLSTALAVLALAVLGTSPDDPSIAEGIAYLVRTQEPDGGWPSCAWISFRTLDGVETYGSRTISTAFCLQALLTESLLHSPRMSGQQFALTPVDSQRRFS